MTEKLYYNDSYIKSFNAAVISCTQENDRFVVVLDKTAFFPEGGGQPADIGFIGNIAVTDVQIVGNEILHYTKAPLPIGAEVECTIDWDIRFARMQNHSGEHILSGILHAMSGCSNVGFHMGADCMTIDFDVEFSAVDLAEAELAANKAVYANVPIRTYFPTEDELKTLDYRSKLDLTEDVRIVDIEGYDLCACCAPHVAHTGEIGIIKITSSMRHRGGTRITAICGSDAFADYAAKHISNSEISALLSAKSTETPQAVERVMAEIQQLKNEIASLKNEIADIYFSSAAPLPNGYVCTFCNTLDAIGMRSIVNRLMAENDKVCAVFSGNDESGYKYVAGSSGSDMTVFAKNMNEAISGRGGGSSAMIQGSAKASRTDILQYFAKL